MDGPLVDLVLLGGVDVDRPLVPLRDDVCRTRMYNLAAQVLVVHYMALTFFRVEAVD